MYIDDALFINTPEFITYPSELAIRNTTDTLTYDSYLDLFLKFDNNRKLTTSLYDKQNYITFSIVNVQFISSNILPSPVYDVYVLHLIRFARLSSGYIDDIFRTHLGTPKLLPYGYIIPKLVF